jgi:hypothetical protein
MADRGATWAMSRGHDATHQASNRDTHLTHGCIQHFCGFGAMLIASRQMQLRGIGSIPPFFAMADSISTGGAR